MCTISKDIGLIKEKELYLPNKEFISDHRGKRKKMAAKYEMFMNSSENCIGIYKKKPNMPNKEYLRDHRCQRTNMA